MYAFLEWQVQDVMSEPLTLSPNATLAEADEILVKHGYNSLPVVDDSGQLLGIVTSLDLLKAFRFSEDVILPPYDTAMARPVSEILSRDVATVRPRTPLTRLLQKIVDTRNKSFPVLDRDRLVGMVAREDVLNALRRASEGERPPGVESRSE